MAQSKKRYKGKSVNKKQLNRRNSTKNERRDEEVIGTARSEMRSERNPYSWYANFPHFMEDVATLAFGLPVGEAVTLNATGTDFVAAAGVMGLFYTPGPGISKDLTSPINRQATRMYTYLRSVQRSAATYDAADLMMYLMAVDSLYTYWAYLRRIYGVAQLFTPVNKYYPRRLLQAMGVDPDDILKNLADFRAFVNRYALNIGRFAVPKDFDIIYRHMWMCSGLYVDGDSAHAQTYFFSPYMLYQYDNTVTTGSQLKAVALDSGTATLSLKKVADLMTFATNLINNMENDEDSMMISGDLYRAYAPSGLMTVEETTESYAIAPAYEKSVLSQIENSVFTGLFREAPVISQNPEVNNGAIIFNPVVHAGIVQINDNLYGVNYPLNSKHVFLNAHHDHPNHEDVTEMTRMISKGANVDDFLVVNSTYNSGLQTCGAEIMNYFRIAAPSATNPNAVRFLYSPTNTIWLDGTTATVSVDPDAIELIALVEQFDWAPMLYIVEATGNSTYDFKQIAADLDNFTVASRTQLGNINEAAMLSVLDNPQPVSK